MFSIIFVGKPWISWAALGLKVANEKHQLRWRNCTDITHAWTGLVILKPGQAEPLHKHTTPMFYYILQVSHTQHICKYKEFASDENTTVRCPIFERK